MQSRYGSGVRVMRLGEGDRVVTAARTEHSDEEETAKPEDDGAEEELSAEELAALEAEEAQNAAGEEDEMCIRDRNISIFVSSVKMMSVQP